MLGTHTKLPLMIKNTRDNVWRRYPMGHLCCPIDFNSIHNQYYYYIICVIMIILYLCFFPLQDASA